MVPNGPANPYRLESDSENNGPNFFLADRLQKVVIGTDRKKM